MGPENVETLEAVKDLNDEFFSFVEGAVKLPMNERGLLDDSVGQYKRHRNEIKDESAQKKAKQPPAAAAGAGKSAPAAAPLFSFGGKPAADAAKPSSVSAPSTSSAPAPLSFGAPQPASSSAPAPLFSFGAPAASSAAAAPLFSFGAPPSASAASSAAAPAPFTFGAAPSSGAAPAPFSFGLSAPAPAPAAAGGGGLFTFGAPAPLQLGGDAEGGEDEEEEQRPPSPSVVKGNADDDWEEAVHSAKAKLYFMPKGAKVGEVNWTDRGVGVLQVRVAKEKKNGSKPARLVMRNDTGKIFLNAALYPGLKVQIKGGKGVVAMLANAAKEEKLPGAADAPKEAAGEAPQLTLTMFKVATVEAAEKLQKAIQDAVPA